MLGFGNLVLLEHLHDAEDLAPAYSGHLNGLLTLLLLFLLLLGFVGVEGVLVVDVCKLNEFLRGNGVGDPKFSFLHEINGIQSVTFLVDFFALAELLFVHVAADEFEFSIRKILEQPYGLHEIEFAAHFSLNPLI